MYVPTKRFEWARGTTAVAGMLQAGSLT